MAAATAVWGIDVGQCSLKALKLRNAGEGKVEAVAFDLIEHPKILSQSDADPDELVRGALEKFASRNDWQGDQFVIGVPGQQTFARFCKMPPVDQKKIPDLVRFEASQQIPFDMDDVVWDYQTFSAADSPDVEVGIFAMRKDLIRKRIEHFSNLGIAPTILQAIPSALYNFCRFDQAGDEQDGAATVLINVGAQNTDLVVVEANSAWTRNIPLGGNSFTEALVRSFKLSFAKAESLKRNAAASKYARQIFQAMRPVFAELVAEVQRSIGFYSSTHRDVELKRVLALGNAFRLPGLQKYLENNLAISGGVLRLEKFNRIVPSATIHAPQFTENILTFASAYGLAVQGLGLAQINASLLPSDLARIAVWKKKRPYFIATAACLGLAALLPWTRNILDQQALASTQAQDSQSKTQQIIAEARRYQNEFEKVATNTTEKEKSIEQLLELQKDSQLVPQILALLHEAMPEIDPELAAVKTPEQLKQLAGRLPRTQRRQLLIDSLRIEYVDDIDKIERLAGGRDDSRGGIRRAARGAGSDGLFVSAAKSGRKGKRRGDKSSAKAAQKAAKGPGFHVTVSGRLLFGTKQAEAITFLTDEYYPNLRELFAQPGLGFYIPDDDPKDKTKLSISRPEPRQCGVTKLAMGRRSSGVLTGGGPAGVGPKDPITGEDASQDWLVEFGLKVKLGQKPKQGAAADAKGKGKKGGD